MRLAVKDLFDTEGVLTTYGSAVFAQHVPQRTARAVSRLEDAGYVNAGKANLHEFGYGITSQNPHYGDVPNPIAPGRIAGGSSGGSAAALAAGLADAALGTDSGGSIRIPASCCGVVGFKPTWDLIPMDGCFPLAPSFDHAGPMARDVEGCALMMPVLAPGFERRELRSLDGLRVGVAWLDRASALVSARVGEAAARFAHARSLELPWPAEIFPAFQREIAEIHRELFARHHDLYGANVRAKIERCLAVDPAADAAARAARERYRREVAAAMDGFDLLMTPTTPVVAPPAASDELGIRERMTEFTFPFNALGAPALALPCGPADDGLPASLQLVGRPGDDALVLAAGALLERALEA